VRAAVYDATVSEPTAKLLPSATMVEAVATELKAHQPFARMDASDVAWLVGQGTVTYHAPGEVVLGPGDGVPQRLLIVRRGAVVGRRDGGALSGPIEYGPGDIFPVAALMAGRAVTSTYRAEEDTFCLVVPAEAVHTLAARAPAWADWLQGRVMQMLELSRRAAQAHWSAQALADQSMESPLAGLPGKPLLTCTPTTPLARALEQMQTARAGSIVVVGADDAPVGIFTRHDVLDRVALPQRDLSTPVESVMSHPLVALSPQQTLQDAALAMSRHGIRHVPVVQDGRLVNIVSERDLFALQRQSLKGLTLAIRRSGLAEMPALARSIRALAKGLLGQGVQARPITEIVSHLNDVLTARVVHLVAAAQGVDLGRACWLAFGSEGRSEQTVATDQDNGLVFSSDAPDADRPRWLAFGRAVNHALADAGYPLCKGGVMAGEPACCLSSQEWLSRFGHWIEHGAPEDLLAASIYFDLRPLAGELSLAEPLLEVVRTQPARVPRFLKQLADNLLRRPVPLNWRGRVDTHSRDGRDWVDLKMQGTALFVDAARLYALAHGIPAQGTRARLEAAGPRLKAAGRESAAWVAGFEFLQMLRLQAQLARPDAEHPNDVEVASLNDIDRRMLTEALRMARALQQRIALDWAA
jgi:CBS domain-containing protein